MFTHFGGFKCSSRAGGSLYKVVGQAMINQLTIKIQLQPQVEQTVRRPLRMLTVIYKFNQSQ